MERFSATWYAVWLMASVVVIVAGYYHPRFWIRLDLKEFTKNGAKDTLLETFHRQRGTWRGLVTLVLATLASLPFGQLLGPFLLSAAGWAVALTGYFVWYFNPQLSLGRQLEYVGKWHVSWNPKAAFWPDRYIWAKAWKEVKLPEEPETPPAYPMEKVVLAAAELLEQHLRMILRVSVGVGVLFISLALLLYA